MKVELSLDRCCGYGNCLLHAEDVFELDDTTGVARLLVVDLPAERVSAVRAAAADCPAAAIAVVGHCRPGTDRCVGPGTDLRRPHPSGRAGSAEHHDAAK